MKSQKTLDRIRTHGLEWLMDRLKYSAKSLTVHSQWSFCVYEEQLLGNPYYHKTADYPYFGEKIYFFYTLKVKNEL
jgi:hypothetical protein